MRRLLALFAVFVGLVSACDDGREPAGASTGPALLSLVDDLPEQGRFEVRARQGKRMSKTTGAFWKLDGDVFTRIEPFDEDVVRRELDKVRRRIEPMLDEPEGTTSTTDIDPRAFLFLSDKVHEGPDFQYDLVSVVVEAMGPTAVPVNPLVARAREACGSATEKLRAEVGRAVAALEPTFVRGTGRRDSWTIPTEPLGKATEEWRRDAIRACGVDEDGTSEPLSCAVRIDRTEATIAVSQLASCGEADADPPSLTLTVTPADVESPPRGGERVSAFDLVSRFVLKINECKALPWEYSDFAAADTFTPPDDEDYLGPTPFVAEYLCEHEVPADRRAEARSD